MSGSASTGTGRDVEESSCFSCRNSADPNAPDRERVLRTAHWRAAHAMDTALAGWLVLLPLEHVTSLDQLTADAAAELGGLLRALTAALIEVTGCVKTYVLLLAEKEGFAHLHLHVVPRAADLAPELRGPGIFALLGVNSDSSVSPANQDLIARRLQTSLGAQYDL